MSFKIAFIDLDGTLLNDQKEITLKVKEAIRKLDQSGVPVILTSGRMPEGVLPIKEELGLNRPIITFGGALVLDENNEVLFSQEIPYEDIKSVLDYVDENNIELPFNLYTQDHWYVSSFDHEMEQLEAEIIGKEPNEVELNEVLDSTQGVYKGLFIGYENEVDSLEEQIKPEFEDLQILRSQYFILEIMRKDISKAVGIQKVLDYYNLKREDSVGFGDEANDLEMLDYVGKPIIMLNAPESLLKNPKYSHSVADNNHDGLALTIEEMFEI